MKTISDMLNSVKRLDIPDAATTAMSEREPQFTVLQKDQLLHGLKADGKQIGLYRSEEYAREKYEQNPLAGFGNVDLRKTGSFYNEIQVSTISEGFIIESTDSKSKKLEKKYGSAFGLENTRRQEFTENIRPVFVEIIEKKLNGLP